MTCRCCGRLARGGICQRCIIEARRIAREEIARLYGQPPPLVMVIIPTEIPDGYRSAGWLVREGRN